MKKFWVGKTFPIAPITTQTTALANDQLPFPTLPPPPPLPPLPPVTPSPRARDISSGRKIHAPGHGAPIGNTVACEHESFPATTTTTTITITTTTTTTTATTTAADPTAAPTAVAATATPEGDPAEAEQRNQDASGDTKRYGLGIWGKQAPLPAKEGGDRGSQAGDRAVGAVGQHEGVALLLRTLYHIAAATSPPPPQSLPLRRMLCSPGIQHSRRSQLSREGSACGGSSSGLPLFAPGQKQPLSLLQPSMDCASSFVILPLPLPRPRTKMLAFFTPAFRIMMILMNVLTIRVVPGSQAAEPKRRQPKRRHPRTTTSPQITQTFGTSGGAALQYHDTPAIPLPARTIPNDGVSTAPITSHITAPMGGNSAGRKKPARRRGETRPCNESSERIREISDEEVCTECHLLLTRSEVNQNKVGKARRGRCNDCFRRMPAPVADMGGPPHSSRGSGASSTESTIFFSKEETGPPSPYPPCQHRANAWETPCPECEKIEKHRFLRRTNPFLLSGLSPACEHRGPGPFLLECSQCREEANRSSRY